MNNITPFVLKESNSEIMLLLVQEGQERLVVTGDDATEFGHLLAMLRDGYSLETIRDEVSWLNVAEDDEIDTYLVDAAAWHNFADTNGLYTASGRNAQDVIEYVHMAEDAVAYMRENTSSVEEIASLVEKYRDLIATTANGNITTRAILDDAETVATIAWLMAHKMPENPTFEQVAALAEDWRDLMKTILGFGSVYVSAWREDEDGDLEEVPFEKASRIEIATDDCQVKGEPRYRDVDLHDDFCAIVKLLLNLSDNETDYDCDGNQAWCWISL